MKLREVFRADFRKNEATLYQEHHNRLVNLHASDVVLFISRNGKILRFVWRPESITLAKTEHAKEAKPSEVLRSATHRILTGGTWNPLALRDYAHKVGIDLEGLRSFEEHMRLAMAHKTQARTS